MSTITFPPQTSDQCREAFADVAAGDRIRLHPGSHPRRWWTVAARNERYLVAYRSEPFTSDGVQYTVIDLAFPYRYNGAGPGVVRSSLNTLGGGWDVERDGTGCDEILRVIESGEWEMSHRRLLNVWAVVGKEAK